MSLTSLVKMKFLTSRQRYRFIIHSAGVLCCLRPSSGLTLAHVKRREPSDTLPRLYIGPQPTNEKFCGIEILAKETTKQQSPPIRSGVVVELSREQSHYLNVVLRRKNKKVRLFDGHGQDWLAEISQEGRNVALAQPYEKIQAKKSATTGRPAVWLCFPPIKKRDRMRWLIEKTTELDCTGYIFLETDHSELVKVQTSKLQCYAVEASEQCERPDLPRFVSVDSPINVSTLFEEALESDASGYAVLVCRERSDALPLLRAFELSQMRQQKQLLILIGPEGGWSPQEERTMDQLQKKCPGIVVNVSLGSRVLRAETAAISALATYHMFRDASSSC